MICVGMVGQIRKGKGVMSVIEDTLAKFIVDVRLFALVGIILLNVVLGVVAALKRGDFSFIKVLDFLRDYVLGMVIPYFAVYAAGQAYGDPVSEWSKNVGVVVDGIILMRAYSHLAEMVPSLPEFKVGLRK
jgi:hypothetical protein